MLDAQPAATAPARPPAIQQLQRIPSDCRYHRRSLRSLPRCWPPQPPCFPSWRWAGRSMPKTLREAMSAAFGASDTQGAWVWKDAYEAAEAAMVLFIQRYGRLMRREAGAGPGSAAAMLAMLETLAALGAVPNKAVGGAACPAAVLHPLAARLRRAASRRHPARRHRAGALGRHRHARRHGRMRPRQARRWRAFGESPAPERDRRRPRRVALPDCSSTRRSLVTTPSPSPIICRACVPPWC